MSHLIQSDPNILGGTPCFGGTRVPIKSLFDYLEGGDTIDWFLEQFPTVSRQQAIAVLQQSLETAEAQANSRATSQATAVAQS